MTFDWLIVYEDKNKAVHTVGCNSEPGSLISALEQDGNNVLCKFDMKGDTPHLLARAATIKGLEQNLSPRRWAAKVIHQHFIDRYGTPPAPKNQRDFENKLFVSGL